MAALGTFPHLKNQFLASVIPKGDTENRGPGFCNRPGTDTEEYFKLNT